MLSKKGFSFVETIVMCAILMIGLLSVYKGYTSSIGVQERRLDSTGVSDEIKIINIRNYLFENVDGFSCEYGEGTYLARKLITKTYNKTGPIGNEWHNKEGTIDLDWAIKDINNLESLKVITCQNQYGYKDEIKSCSAENHYLFIAHFKEKITGTETMATLECPKK